MNKILQIIGIFLLITIPANTQPAATQPPAKFRTLILTERGGLHEPFVAAGLAWLHTLAAGLPIGPYFCDLRAGVYKETKKLVLLR